MYVPHLEAILKNIGVSREEFNQASTINIPTTLFRFLLQVVVASGDFDKTGYLAANKDIADAVQDGSVANPQLHYVQFGFFEGRTGATPAVNEGWYIKTYQDVGEAVRAGALASASEHFIIQGASEGRSPNEKLYVDATQWKTAFGLM
jgi:hypothetical protein